MYRIGHKGINLLMYAPVLMVLLYLDLYILAVVGLVIQVSMYMFPDMDMTKELMTHRGYTHSIIFAGLVSLGVLFTLGIIWFYFPVESLVSSYSMYSVAIAFFVFYAIFSHILGDVITPSGVRMYRPVSSRRHNGRINSNSYLWNWFFYFLGFFSVVFVLILFVLYF